MYEQKIDNRESRESHHSVRAGALQGLENHDYIVDRKKEGGYGYKLKASKGIDKKMKHEHCKDVMSCVTTF